MKALLVLFVLVFTLGCSEQASITTNKDLENKTDTTAVIDTTKGVDTIQIIDTVPHKRGLRIYYLRHAEGGHNVVNLWKDVPPEEWPSYVGDENQFTPLGLLQVDSVATKLKALEPHFDFIASSSLWRARNTILPYLKEMGVKGEIWPELAELSVYITEIFRTDLPIINDTILGKGPLIVLPSEEVDWFTLREDGKNEFLIPPYSVKDSVTAASIFVYKTAVDLLLERFSGTNKTILLVGHGISGVNLLRLLTNNRNQKAIVNTGIWMIEQQSDGSFMLKLENNIPIINL